MPAQPGRYLRPQRRAVGRLARSGAFEPAVRLLLGAAGPAVAGPGIPVALDLAADRAGVASRHPGDGADRIARAQPVGDQDALLLIEVARVDPFGFVHGGTIPVHACLLVPPGGAGAPVAPYLAGVLGDPDRMGGLGEVHVPSSSGRRTYSSRLAAHISFLVGYSTPLNVQRRSPPRSSFRWLPVT